MGAEPGFYCSLFIITAGQIIATSHYLTPNGGLVRETRLFQGKSRLVKYYSVWPDYSG